MASFDAAAATAAYLAQIPPAARAAADAQARAGVSAWAIGWIGAVLLAALLVRSGVIEDLWRSKTRGPVASSVLVILLTAVLSCGWELMARLISGQSLAASTPAVFFAEIGLRVLAFAVVLALLRLAGGRPRLVLGVVSVAASFALVFGPEMAAELSPAVEQVAPATLAAATRDLARVSGVSAGSVVVSASAPGEGDVVGVLHPPRIVLNPEALHLSLAEVRAAVGHVLGHYRNADEFGWAAVLAALSLGGLLFVVGSAGPAGRILGVKNRSTPDRLDARHLPLIWALTVVWMAIAQPVAFAYDRAINMRADAFSLEHAREPDGLAKALIRENGSAPVDPTLIETLIVCSHPALKSRLLQAMTWKAAHAR